MTLKCMIKYVFPHFIQYPMIRIRPFSFCTKAAIPGPPVHPPGLTQPGEAIADPSIYIHYWELSSLLSFQSCS